MPCADELDFKDDPVNGRLQLNSHFAETSLLTFEFILNGAQDVFEEVTDLPELIVPEDGLYLVIYDARGKAAVQSVAAGSIVGASVSAQLRIDNVAVSNSERMLAATVQGLPGLEQPAMQTQGTGSCSTILQLNQGDGLSIWAKRNADAGTVTSVMSDDDGRTSIVIYRLAGS